MKWEDEGIVLAVRPYGERNLIIDSFTPSKGRHSGMVRNANSNKTVNYLEPGVQLRLVWAARLHEHLGIFSTELVKSRTLNLIKSRDALLGFNSMLSILLITLPEREPFEKIYSKTIGLIELIENRDDWIAKYVEWELFILSELGYGLDLSTCVVSGENSNLIYVSPKSGRAVSESAGKDWKNKLLALPLFLLQEQNCVSSGELLDGLTLTGYFLRKWALPNIERKSLPNARQRFINSLFR